MLCHATLIIHRKCRLGTMGLKCEWVKKPKKQEGGKAEREGAVV